MLSKGDIIAFTDPSDNKKTILHRIYIKEIKGKAISFRTKGDHNGTPDNWVVPAIAVKGRVYFIVPYLGYLSAFIKTLPGFLLFVILPVGIFIMLQIKKIREGIEEEVSKRTKKALEYQSKTQTIIFLFFSVSIAMSLSSFYGGEKYGFAQSSGSARLTGISFTVGKTPAFTPTPTPCSCPGKTCNITINQSNNTTIINNVSTLVNTGDNTVSGNSGNTQITTGSSSATVTITNKTGSNSANLSHP